MVDLRNTSKPLAPLKPACSISKYDSANFLGVSSVALISCDQEVNVLANVLISKSVARE